MSPNPEGPVDQRAQVIAVESADDGTLLGLVVKYACHPVTVVGLGLGADYPGYMREIVEAKHPGCIVLFLQGCGADVRIRVLDEAGTGWVSGTLKKAEQFGRQLAEAVERAIQKPGKKISGPIAVGYREIQLPLDLPAKEAYLQAAERNDNFSGKWGKRYASMLKRGETIPDRWPFRIQAMRFGPEPEPFILVALDGEVFTEYGLNIGKKLAPATTIVLGYSNGVVSYLPTAEAIAAGGYEATAFRNFGVPGPYSQNVEQIVTEQAVALARTIEGKKLPAQATNGHGHD